MFTVHQASVHIRLTQLLERKQYFLTLKLSSCSSSEFSSNLKNRLLITGPGAGSVHEENVYVG